MSNRADIAAIAALVISLVSISVSAWTMRIQRETRRLRQESGPGSKP